MDACRTLKEYAMYVEQVRIYGKQMPLAEAVEKAVDKCIAEGFLSEFLKQKLEEKTRTIIRNMLARDMTDGDIMAIADCGRELIDQVRKETIPTKND